MKLEDLERERSRQAMTQLWLELRKLQSAVSSIESKMLQLDSTIN